jgi:hypothetical protein
MPNLDAFRKSHYCNNAGKKRSEHVALRDGDLCDHLNKVLNIICKLPH